MKSSDARAIVLLVQTMAQIERGEVKGTRSELRTAAARRFLESVKEPIPTEPQP